jgi:hypothetical protein
MSLRGACDWVFVMGEEPLCGLGPLELRESGAGRTKNGRDQTALPNGPTNRPTKRPAYEGPPKEAYQTAPPAGLPNNLPTKLPTKVLPKGPTKRPHQTAYQRRPSQRGLDLGEEERGREVGDAKQRLRKCPKVSRGQARVAMVRARKSRPRVDPGDALYFLRGRGRFKIVSTNHDIGKESAA